MDHGRYSIEPLGPQHDRAAFSCSAPALDGYFRERAGQDMRRRLAAVFVLVETAADEVVGFYTLNATAIEPAGLPTSLTRRLPRYDAFPAVLLGRLAVSLRVQRRGFGELLLLDAMHRALAQSTQIAAMAMVVDAKDDGARRFYERFGFQRLLDDERRLFIPMTTIARLS